MVSGIDKSEHSGKEVPQTETVNLYQKDQPADNIPFNIPLVIGKETKYVAEVVDQKKFCGDGPFTVRCHEWLVKNSGTKKALLTTSCTHALEMAALLLEIQPGDEIIMPSFTFVSTANPFALRGAKIIFVDIKVGTLNIDELKIEAAITAKTKAIVPVHYAGVACEMDTIMQIANEHDLFVVEDAAQSIGATYKNMPLGTIGHMGCYSFHDTKNIQCGEGGALLINDEKFIERAEIIREKGTNRSAFLRGQIDKYTWKDIGSSYLPNEITAAFLYAQLENTADVTNKRVQLWNRYYQMLQPLAESKKIELPEVVESCAHNGHLFYIRVKDIDERQKLIGHLKEKNICSVFHYIPLHIADAGKRLGDFCGDDEYTTSESERLLRLPMYYDLSMEEVDYVCHNISSFYD